MENYNDNQLSRKFTLWITKKGYSNRVKEAEREIAERREQRKREKEKERKRKQLQTHPVEVQLTKRQSDGLLYVALKPSRKELFAKRYFYDTCCMFLFETHEKIVF